MMQHQLRKCNQNANQSINQNTKQVPEVSFFTTFSKTQLILLV